ncbi:helix-turn-helix transcriptional regulator [Pseudomonas mandelii]|uniref:helix-turn-helix transcriptional regulator n=1 Tax=Pseudomonas mandelii TaxID=75612 RepID=UPI0005B30D8B|nr:AraC family transcriptional regulator [Pseudomonas mandelii]OYQ23301.1 AraC family transcriptional regulator [Pseudomonas mandelii]
MDRLSSLMSRFGVRANLFYNDKLCGVQDYGGFDQRGHIHLLKSGTVTVQGVDKRDMVLTQPSLIFLPRSRQHRLFADESEGAWLLCATMDFEGGIDNPLSSSLPDMLVLPLNELPLLATTLTWMFEEAAEGHCGKEAVINRLFELLIILLFRHLLDQNQLQTGLMAGLADPRLAHSLVSVHDAPHHPWSIAEMAEESNMSRSAYAAHFRTIVGQTPAEYLLSWRVSLAQKLLREGRAINLIAADVGYDSPSALSRAFRRKTGVSPREWIKGANGI